MAIKGYEKVTLAGKEYTLRIDLNAVCDLEEIFGKGIIAILNEEQVGFKLLRTFYYVALKWKFHNLQIDQVGRLLQSEMERGEQGIGELMTPVMNALKKSKLLQGKKKDGGDDVHLEAPEVEEDEFEESDEEKEDNDSFPE